MLYETNIDTGMDIIDTFRKSIDTEYGYILDIIDTFRKSIDTEYGYILIPNFFDTLTSLNFHFSKCKMSITYSSA